MIYIIEESVDYYADKGYHAIYASKTLQCAQVAVTKFIENNKNEEIYDYGYDEKDKIWWYETNQRMLQIISLPLNS